MSYVGSYSTVLYSVLPFNVPVDANVADSLVRSNNVFFPEVVSQAAKDAAYIFYPPATNFNMFSSEIATILLSEQES